MIEPSLISPALLEGARAETKAYLRLETATEDRLIDQLLGEAAALAEAFTAQALFIRAFTEITPARAEWTRLSMVPVRTITGVEGVPAEGAAFALPVASYNIDIDASGTGWLRVSNPGSAGRVRVSLTAGLAADWSGLPEPLRLGIMRLTAHCFTHRDAPDDAGPPASVAALLRPWRRMRLS